MHYKPRDRSPLYDFNFWDETVPAWHKQGLPEKYTRENVREFFGLDCSLAGGADKDWEAGINVDLCPYFEGKILDDDGDVYTQLQGDGVLVRKQRSSVSIPMHVGHTLVDRESWKKHYLPKLDPSNPQRYPKDWDRRVKVWADPNRDHPTFLSVGSLFGRLRDWMGIDNLAMVVYDDPAWFEEMVETMADLAIGVLKKVFATGARFEAGWFWEDMCYSGGPLLSPDHFKKYLVPNYQRVTSLLRQNNIDVVFVDCDGKIDALIPHWLDAGVNCLFPIEVGTWHADPIALRKQYGKQLLMMGGFDKHILQADKRAIEREVNRLAPLVEEGGFIAFADHRVPPDVPLENYIHYCRTVRRVWGRNINLKPMAAPERLNTRWTC